MLIQVSEFTLFRWHKIVGVKYEAVQFDCGRAWIEIPPSLHDSIVERYGVEFELAAHLLMNERESRRKRIVDAS